MGVSVGAALGLTDLLGPTVGGIAGSALLGAGGGAALSGVTGGDPLKGALGGAITGGFIPAGGALGGELGLGATAGDIIGGVAGGALGAGVTGGNPLTGAAIGGIGGGLTAALSPSAAANPGTAPSAGPSAGAGGGGGVSSAGASAAPSSVPIDVSAAGPLTSAYGTDVGTGTLNLAQGGNIVPSAGALTGAGTGGGGFTAGPTGFPTGQQVVDATFSGNTSNIPTPATGAGVGAGGGASPWSNFANNFSLSTPGADLANLGKAAISSPGALVAGGALGLDYLTQPKTPSISGVTGTLQNEAAALGGQSAQLESYLGTGTLPPGVQASLNSAAQSAKASIRSRYAQMGSSGSSAEQQDLANVDTAVATQGASIATQLLQQGVSEGQLSANLYNAILQQATAQNAALSGAIGNFASALAGGGTTLKLAAA